MLLLPLPHPRSRLRLASCPEMLTSKDSVTWMHLLSGIQWGLVVGGISRKWQCGKDRGRGINPLLLPSLQPCTHSFHWTGLKEHQPPLAPSGLRMVVAFLSVWSFPASSLTLLTPLYIVPSSNSLQLIVLSMCFLLHLNKYRFFDTLAQSTSESWVPLIQGDLKFKSRQLRWWVLGF